MSATAIEAIVCLSAAVVGFVVLFGMALREDAMERRAKRNQRERLMNEAIQRDIAAKSRKHDTMRQMRDVARDYRRP
ncbi:hypothetical protein [Streptomyces sp. NPDC051554]|uniref:hypothetical protein n=1 Tax=Streptomyces sp. NPDC051554 TaxID=3365656 RepID=UPI0037982A2C